MAASPERQKSPNTLLLIAIFKLLKGVALVAVAIGAHKLIHRDVAEVIDHWVRVLRVDADNRYIHMLLARLLRVNPHQLKALSAGTFVYAAILLTEGIGLLLRKRWAEYFTIISTGGLIPLEIFELVKHVTLIKVIVVLVNVAIVVYLIFTIRHAPTAKTPAKTPVS